MRALQMPEGTARLVSLLSRLRVSAGKIIASSNST
jgi:hypothetical protein